MYFSHLQYDSQRVTSKRKLRKGEMELRMENDERFAAVALGVVNLKLPSGYSLYLEMLFASAEKIKNVIMFLTC